MAAGEARGAESGRLAALLADGRFGEAARVLGTLASSGHGASEISIWLGRIHEGRGRLAEAEASLRKAVKLDRRAASPRVELARLLERRGRGKEAAALLEEVRDLDGDSAELCLSLGRLWEGLGEAGKAEKEFLKAAALDPRSPVPFIERGRVLEKAGKPAEARAALDEAEPRARAELGSRVEGILSGGGRAGDDDGFFALLKHSLCREVFRKEAACGPRAAARARQALGTSLSRRERPQARMLLCELLLDQGRAAEAEVEFGRALDGVVSEGDGLGVDALAGLAEAGRVRAVHRLLDRLAARGGARAAAFSADWSRLISVLVCAGLYPEAFELAEIVLSRFPGAVNPQCFQWPWWSKRARGVAEEDFCRKELKVLDSAPRDPRFLHWFSYCRAVLLNGLNRRAEALAAYAPIRALRSGRHAWMHQPFLLIALMQDDFPGSVEIARRILAETPSHWWARCRLAEAYLALGRRREAFRELERAERSAQVREKREVLTWHGEVLLWLGLYRRALGKFEAALRLGAETFVHGWRGAALLKLGRSSDALEALNLAISLDAKDFEARLWRGEALRLLGRHKDALADFDEAVRGAPSSVWGHADRGLSRLALGDEAGLAEDFAAVDPAIADFLRLKAGVPRKAKLGPPQMKAVLEKGLELGRGVRRPEDYLHFLWMGPGAAAVGRGRAPEHGRGR